jgi:hypothetical protein
MTNKGQFPILTLFASRLTFLYKIRDENAIPKISYYLHLKTSISMRRRSSDNTSTEIKGYLEMQRHTPINFHERKVI